MFNASKFAVACNALIVVAFGRESVAFRIVVVPVVAPIVIAVPAPPIFNAVASVLKTFAVPDVVVMSPPLIARSPDVVI